MAKKSREQVVVRVFQDGFYIDSCELEDFKHSRETFIDTIKQNKLPVDILNSANYPGENVDYCFDYKDNELGTTLAWRNYESKQVELKEYDPDWANLYRNEYENILVRHQQ